MSVQTYWVRIVARKWALEEVFCQICQLCGPQWLWQLEEPRKSKWIGRWPKCRWLKTCEFIVDSLRADSPVSLTIEDPFILEHFLLDDVQQFLEMYLGTYRECVGDSRQDIYLCELLFKCSRNGWCASWEDPVINMRFLRSLFNIIA